MALSTIGTNSLADNAVTLAKATGFGKILQIIHGSTATQVTSTSASQSDTGLTASITPSSTSSKVFISLTQTFGKNATDTQIDAYLYRDSTTIVSEWLNDDIRTGDASNFFPGTSSIVWLDSPSSTSSVAYKTTFRNATGNGTVYAQPNTGRSSIILMEVGA